MHIIDLNVSVSYQFKWRAMCGHLIDHNQEATTPHDYYEQSFIRMTTTRFCGHCEEEYERRYL